MQTKDIDGKKLAKKLKTDLQMNVSQFHQEFGFAPRLAIIYVGEDPAADTYIKSKRKTCRKVGMESELYHFPESFSLNDLRKQIKSLNEDSNIHGIILEMPLPEHIPFLEAAGELDPIKDVDGLHPDNLGWLFSGSPLFVPNTPMAVMRILKEYNVSLKGKNVVIVGRSLAVGKPLIALMLAENATVTTCHSRTTDLKHHTSQADVLVVAAGKPRIVTADMVREGAVVIDVGINVTDDGLVGDVDYNGVYSKASLITPVPGGVGPITVSMLMENTLRAAQLQVGNKHHRKNVISMGR